MLVVLPADHPLARRSRLRLTDLADQPWLLGGGPGCPDGAMILRACHGAGFDPRIEISFPTDDYHATQGLVAAGAGVTLLPRLSLAVPRDDLASGPCTAAWPAGSWPPCVTPPGGPATLAMLELLRQAAAQRPRSG